jgi:enoyl-CoA hydratase/carnithine racemase
MTGEVLVARRGPVAIVTLNRPHRLNAISGSLLVALHGALAALADAPDVRCIVLHGAGRAFCAGDDLREFAEQSRDRASAEAHVGGIQQITRDLMAGRVPVIGAVHGYAVGGGFEWLLNCDLVVAASDLVAFFPEMGIGQFVTGGVTWLLPRGVGHQRAMELLLLGERQSAARLAELGLVNRVVAPEALLPAALALADEVAARSAFSVGRLKRTLHELSAIDRALELEQVATIEAFLRDEAAEGAVRFYDPDR